MAESVTVQMEKILDEYLKEVQEVTNDAIDKIAKESAKKLKNTSPRKTGDYAKGWRVKALNKHGRINNKVVHNATDYQLTHLLENGHVIKNIKGTYGRTHPIKHIEPVEQWAQTALVEEIEAKL